MTPGYRQQFDQVLFSPLPVNGSTVDNAKPFEHVLARTKAVGSRCSRQNLSSAREALVEASLALTWKAPKAMARGGEDDR